MEPLATLADLVLRMSGTPDTDRATAALVDASATVRAFTGQVFTRVVTTDIVVVRAGTARLSQRPVNDVTDVTVGGEPIGFVWQGGDRLSVDAVDGRVAVTSDHGYDTMPDDIVTVTCNVAARALATPPEDAGLMSRSITNFSESYGAVGAAGPAGLFNDERAILQRYKRIGGSAKLRVGH